MEKFERCFGCLQKIANTDTCPYCNWKQGTSDSLDQHLSPGTKLHNRYLIGRVLGQGGFGITYIAWDTTLHLRVAIKEYMPNGIATRNHNNPNITLYTSEDLEEQYAYGLAGFIEEARALARYSNHPNIVTVRDYFEANNTAYLAMDYIEGITYKEYLKRRGNQISIEETMGVIVPIMNALEKIHSAGLLHRDISPDNIYITHENEVVLLDFGAARYALGDKSKSFSVILKAGYAPEEQYRSRGIQGPFTDVYALGATIYRSITGQVPSDALDRFHEDILTLPSSYGIELPGGLEVILMKALAIMAKDRYQSVGDFRTDLQSVVKAFLRPDYAAYTDANKPSKDKTAFVAPLSPAPEKQYSETFIDEEQRTLKKSVSSNVARTAKADNCTNNVTRLHTVNKVWATAVVIFVLGFCLIASVITDNKLATTLISSTSQTPSTSASSTNAEGDQQVITYPGGDKYDGIILNGKKNGQGTMTYADGSTYSGGWVDDMKSGQGTLTNTKGTYTGAWANDKRNGQGTLTYATGNKYTGTWIDDSKEGQGTMNYSDGTTYTGQWKNGSPLSNDPVSLAGIALSGSITKDSIVEKLGKPASEEQNNGYSENAGPHTEDILNYGGLELSFYASNFKYAPGILISMRSTSAAFPAGFGVKPGDSVDVLLKAYGQPTNKNNQRYDYLYPESSDTKCVDFKGASRMVSFFIDNGSISSIWVGPFEF